MEKKVKKAKMEIQAKRMCPLTPTTAEMIQHLIRWVVRCLGGGGEGRMCSGVMRVSSQSR
jgi:hypothetical protein